MDSEKPTNPHGMSISHEDQMAYLIGSLQRIELQLASDEPPPWAKRFLTEISTKVQQLESEIKQIQNTCKTKHSNGSSKLPLI